ILPRTMFRNLEWSWSILRLIRANFILAARWRKTRGASGTEVLPVLLKSARPSARLMAPPLRFAPPRLSKSHGPIGSRQARSRLRSRLGWVRRALDRRRERPSASLAGRSVVQSGQRAGLLSARHFDLAIDRVDRSFESLFQEMKS